MNADFSAAIPWLVLFTFYGLPLLHVALSRKGGGWRPPAGSRCPFGPRAGWLVMVLMLTCIAGLGLTAFMCTMASGRFLGDWLTTRWGIRRILQLSGTLTAAGLLIAILFPWLLPALAGFLFVGAGVSSVVPLVYSAAGRSKVLSPGVALAAVSTIGYLGFLFGPPFIGFIAQAFSLRVSLGLIAILGSIIALFASRIK